MGVIKFSRVTSQIRKNLCVWKLPVNSVLRSRIWQTSPQNHTTSRYQHTKIKSIPFYSLNTHSAKLDWIYMPDKQTALPFIQSLHRQHHLSTAPTDSLPIRDRFSLLGTFTSQIMNKLSSCPPPRPPLWLRTSLVRHHKCHDHDYHWMRYRTFWPIHSSWERVLSKDTEVPPEHKLQHFPCRMDTAKLRTSEQAPLPPSPLRYLQQYALLSQPHVSNKKTCSAMPSYLIDPTACTSLQKKKKIHSLLCD